MTRLLLVFLIIYSCAVMAQESAVTIRPNRGQWYSKIDYLIGLQGGNMYLEQTGFTYFFYQLNGHNHDASHEDGMEEEAKGHCVKSIFLNAQKSDHIAESKQQSYYRNYFLGSDQNYWKSEIHDIQEVEYKAKYPNIDLLFSTANEQAKYSWIILPGGNFRDIQWQYEGAKETSILSSGELKVNHGLGYYIEGKPVAWKLKNGRKIPLNVNYQLKDNIFSFDLSGSFTDSDTVVIDPSLTFSSFTGSLADNWGFTAAPDPNGNLYAGGIVFGVGYPVTTGSVDQTFSGGTPTDGAPTTSPLSKGFDVGISKFNSQGTAFIFSTYIGGAANETPHSIVSDENGNMFLLGVTASTNFPIGSLAYQNSFNGGTTVSPDNLKFDGSDIYVLELNPTGTTLMASTYVGGTGNDGMSFGTLQYNYGDNFRGEIMVDQSFVYFSSVTQSTNFPTVLASQASLNGTQDAVVVKMTKNLSSIVWSTYYGGSNDDTGNGISLSGNGSLYVTGGTNSSNLNLGTAGGWDLSYNSGRDGFVTRFDVLTGAVLNGTYIGTADYDQGYFVQVDNDNDVYLLGQTAGSWPITPGCYGNANSGQYIMKFNPTLTNQFWVTTIGASSGDIEISPTAFLISNCKDIYVSGWGGLVNSGNSQAVTSSSNNFPVSSDAFQNTTNGSNFWIAVLSENAATLKYATYIGGSGSSFNHVDGGTSRFDKNGNIYHAVCGACGGNNFGFTTTPNVIGPQNLSPNCNLAAFKFELSTIEAIVSTPNPLICYPDPVIFNNNSANGNEFFWDFGDGSTSNLVNPSHVYSGPGQYTVTLVVRDTAQCYSPDTVQFEVNIGDFNGGVVDPDVIICPGQTAQLEAFGGSTYSWSPAQFLNNPSIPNPIASVTQNTLFTCIISDSCGVDTVQVQVSLLNGNVNVSADTSICIGESVPLFIDGVPSAVWTPSLYLDNPNSLTPISTPTNTVTYQVSGITTDGCQINKDVTIQVFFEAPSPVIPDTLKYCDGGSATLTVSGATTYSWSPTNDITPTTGATVVISTTTEQYYYCMFTNACESVLDSVYIDLIQLSVTAGFDTTVCPGEVAFMQGFGAVNYSWNPAVSPITANYDSVSVVPPATTTYMVYGTDQYGCVDSASVTITLFPQPFIQTNPDVFGVFGEPVQLSATSTTGGQYVWSPEEYLSCVVCTDPIAQPDQNFTYTVTYTDENGCSASDNVYISYEALIYVPNTFTPNGNATNETFFALGVNIDEFNMEIYNRWGELIYTGDKLSKSWDGTYNDLPCPDGVYVWKIRYGEIVSSKMFEIVGHVNLLR